MSSKRAAGSTLARPILLVQISDLHFGPHNRFSGLDPGKLAAQFAQAIDREAQRLKLGVPIQLILMTGDVAEAARPREYEDAITFFSQFSETIKLSISRIIFVPGNHDVSWAATKRAEIYQDEYDLPADEVRRRMDKVKLRQFFGFVRRLHGGDLPGYAIKNGARVYEFDDLLVTVVSLNSCEAESHKKIDHRGLLSEDQAQSVLDHFPDNPASRSHIKILLVHHNPVVTVQENVEAIISHLRKSANIDLDSVERYISDIVGFEGLTCCKELQITVKLSLCSMVITTQQTKSFGHGSRVETDKLMCCQLVVVCYLLISYQRTIRAP